MRILESLRRVRSFLNNEADVELDEELRFHLERQIEENLANGMSPEVARRSAMLEFGSVTQVTEQCYEARGFTWLHDLLQDLRYGVGMLIKNRAFACATILVLAMGIGACTAIFSLVNAVLVRSLPYGNAGQLVYLFTPLPHLNLPPEVFGPSYADILDIQKQSHSYTGITAFSQHAYNLASPRTVERIGGAKVDAQFFSVLQASPERGRAISFEDDQPGHDNVAIISHSLWKSMFAGSADILAKSLLLDGKTYQIIGVMPPQFQYPHGSDLAYDGDSRIDVTQVWVPLALNAEQKADRDNASGYAVARLKPLVSVQEAQAEMQTIMFRLDLLHSADMRGWTAFVEPFQEGAFGAVRPLMLLLLGAVSFVLLIACANAANLLLARTASRTLELGVRATLGAGRSRLIRQMLTESLLVGAIAGLLGIALAYFCVRILIRLDPGNIPRLSEATLDVHVLSFVVGTTLLTAMMFGILPALFVSRANLVDFIKSGASRGVIGTRSRLGSGLVVAQVALVVILLTGAGLLIRSYENVLSVKTGFSQRTISMSLQLDDRYGQAQLRIAFFQSLAARLNTMPGIQAAGAVNSLPLSKSETMTVFWADGFPNQKDQLVESREATPNYFSAMSIPLLKGRLLSDRDTSEHAQVAIINQALVEKYFPGVDPTGRRIRMGDPNAPWQTVVGVIGDVRHSSLEEPPIPQVYSTFGDTDSAYLAVRSILPTETIVTAVRSTVQSLDPNLAVADIHSMGDLVSGATAKRRFQTSLLTAFSALALFLALAGLYGLLEYSVKQRTGEIGVRMALGASRMRVVSMVVKEGMRSVLIGQVIGIAGALALTRLLASPCMEFTPSIHLPLS